MPIDQLVSNTESSDNTTSFTPLDNTPTSDAVTMNSTPAAEQWPEQLDNNASSSQEPLNDSYLLPDKEGAADQKSLSEGYSDSLSNSRSPTTPLGDPSLQSTKFTFVQNTEAYDRSNPQNAESASARTTPEMRSLSTSPEEENHMIKIDKTRRSPQNLLVI